MGSPQQRSPFNIKDLHMRHRLEDLGRLTVILDTLSDHDLFSDFEQFGKHHTFEQWLNKQDEEKRSDYLYTIMYQIRYIHDKLCECVCIGKGLDSLAEYTGETLKD